MIDFCWRRLVWGSILLAAVTGCGQGLSSPEIVWGRRGVAHGDFVKPRAVAIDSRDRLFIVDFTARIQVFDRHGHFLGPTWTTPDYRNGRPSGLSIDRNGNLLVSDSHYSCLRTYTPEGKLLQTIGGENWKGPSPLGYISDAVQDEDGYYYLAEFSENQRITKLNPDGSFRKSWGSAGTAPGEFARIRALAFRPRDSEQLLYVADACNHRIQVFTRDGQLRAYWGVAGQDPGELSYPYDLAFGPQGDVLYVVEYGNHRVQKFRPDGTSLGCWGGPGREPGQLHSPWALVVDSKGRVHVLDSENHRVQRVTF
jgi:DNA-binding beta-propeller fold protein YncE